MDGYNLAQWCVCARTFVGFVILFRVCLARVAFCASLTLCNALPGQTGARFNPYEDEHYSKELPADGHQTLRREGKRVGLGCALATKVTFLENAPQNCVTLPKSARRSGCSLPVL